MSTVEELAKRLSIEIEFKDAGTAYWAGDHTLTVTLKLDEEAISTSTTYLPNTSVEKPY